MMTRATRNRLANLAVFLIPLLLVRGVAVLFGSAPEGAFASDGGGNTPSAIQLARPSAEWTAEQEAAGRRIMSLRGQAFGESPLFHYMRSAPVVDPVVDPNPGGPRVPPPPDVVVQMILTSRTGNIALIDRKRYKVGDTIGDEGWVITEIDGVSRAVKVVHPPTKGEATLMVPLPR